MKLPELNELPATRTMIDVFRGYNHNLRIGEGEFYDMKNLTSNDYPVLSPRPKRGVYEKSTKEKPINFQGLISKDTLCYVKDGVFYVGGSYYVSALKLTDGEKTLVSMGAYVIIMPDKVYVNTENLNEYGKIEASVTTTNTVTFELCKLDGEGYKDENGNDIDISSITSPTAPSEPANLELWIDTSSTPHTLKQYSKANEQWVSVATTYIKIHSAGIGEPFSVNDGVTISGIVDESLKDLNSTTIIWAKGSNYIVVTGILDKVTSQDEPITVERKMPNMDFIIESENRLWGCRYGVALNGEVVNEIYASKLGDFKNWNCFAGISTDSYVASVGSDGQFTGAITHLGYPLFFKENCMHKVYGNYPANYQIQTTACRGVQKGCPKSLAIVNEVLYYKSRSSICSYDGSLPVEISSALGDVAYSNAVAGALGNKYYVSMSDSNEVYHLFVYDTKKGMWHREDNTHATDFCACRGNLFYIEVNEDEQKSIKAIKEITELSYKLNYEAEASPAWSAETGIIGTDSPDKKYISRLDVRLSINIGARVYFYIQYDSSGDWEHICTMTGRTLKSFAVPIRPRRCDHLRLRIDGDGETKIYSICKTIEQGSDM